LRYYDYVKRKNKGFLIMNIREQARRSAAQNRSQDRIRQEKVLARAAKKVGLSVEEATSHAWTVHTN
jgi:type V secretory pathway adhesin AidA